ncbi:toxin-antitoxin system YwqK family antitoxin [Roseivirga misakiensis]|uniref:Uncharacterized protein n=1 Tax=Roseivirga misakiensis TaxID=1563681 RepID=A0A1E5SKQ0_9BACT|nr:toxin-antitoxin system YwqK family antitoxin [Roseivirga misakiensis]OEJ99700.1 hypothetical protein BFP71_09015 [Roseivirga misakiensis]
MKYSWILPFLILTLTYSNNLLAQDTTAYINSGQVIEQAIKLHDEGKFDEALKYYSIISKSDTNYIRSVSERALTLLAKGDYQEAVNLSREAIEVPSQFKANLINTLGTALDYLGNSEECFKVFEDGLARYPYHRQMIYNYGVSLNRNGQFELAQEAFEKALSIEPFHAGSHLALAELMVLQGHRTKALLSYFTYLAIRPADTETVIKVENLLIDGIKEEGSIESFSPNDFEDLDALIRSKVADQSIFKPSVKLNFRITRHAEVLITRLQPIEGEDFWSTFYLPFFLQLNDSKKLSAFLYTIVSGLNVPEIQDWIKKKEKEISSLSTLAQEVLGTTKLENETDIFGAKGKFKFWYFDDGKLNAIGNSDEETNPIGPWIYFYANGQKSAEGKYNEQAQKVGLWTYYEGNGQISSTEVYDQSGLLNGDYKSYHSNGQLNSIVPYNNNEATGTINIFNDCGLLVEAYEVKNSVVSGPGKYFYSDSTLSIEYSMADSQLEGPFVEYYKGGEISKRANYSGGLLDGEFVTYYENGQVSQQGEYKDNELNGPWIGYFEDGKESFKVEYGMGKLIGQGLYYFDNGELSESINYKDGNLDSTYKTFDKDGLLHYEFEYDSGKVIGFKYLDKANNVLSTGNSLDTLSITGYTPKGILLYKTTYVGGYENGVRTTYHSNGKVSMIVNVVNDLFQGEYKEFDQSGKLTNKSIYVDGVTNGWYENYYSNGNKIVEGYSVNDNAEQIWKNYYPDGTLSDQTYNSQGQDNGYQYSYTPDGQLFSRFKWKMGTLEEVIQYDSLGNELTTQNLPNGSGKLIINNASGKKRSEVSYECGVLTGTPKTFFEDGTINSSGIVKDGKYNGMHNTYYPDGTIYSYGVYKNDLLDSTWILNDVFGNLSVKREYKDGEISGDVFNYHKNGKVESKCTYVEGKKHGSCEFYAPDGALQMIKNYDKEKGIVSYQYEKSDGNLTDPIPIINTESTTIKAYYRNGKISVSQGYKNGLLNGKTIYYFPNGNISEEIDYLDGDSHGFTKEFYSNGQLYIEQEWYYDYLVGKSKIYYENGQLKRVTDYRFDKKHGKDIWFNNSGEIERSINYWNDEIY